MRESANTPPPISAAWPSPESGLVRRSVDVDGLRLSYVTGGSGDAVLLLHGVGACNLAWRYVLPVLIPQYTVYALDLVGCGESDKPPTDYTLEMIAASIDRFMDRLGIARAHVIGHSFGGGVAMTFRRWFPERVGKLVLASSGGLGRDLHWLLRASTLPGAQGVLGALASPALRVPQASRALEQRRLRRLGGELAEAAPTVLDRLRDPQTRRAFISMLRQAAGVRGQRISALDWLPQMDSPTLVVWGALDRTIPFTHGVLATALLPCAHLEILPNCYHRPQIEAPDAFNELVLRFLAAEQWPPEREVAPRFVTRRPARWRRIAPAALLVAAPMAGAGMSLAWRARRRRRLGA